MCMRCSHAHVAHARQSLEWADACPHVHAADGGFRGVLLLPDLVHGTKRLDAVRRRQGRLPGSVAQAERPSHGWRS